MFIVFVSFLLCSFLFLSVFPRFWAFWYPKWGLHMSPAVWAKKKSLVDVRISTDVKIDLRKRSRERLNQSRRLIGDTLQSFPEDSWHLTIAITSGKANHCRPWSNERPQCLFELRMSLIVTTTIKIKANAKLTNLAEVADVKSIIAHLLGKHMKAYIRIITYTGRKQRLNVCKGRK